MTIDKDQPSPANAGARHTHRWTCAIVATALILALGAFHVPGSPVAHAAALLAAQQSSVWDGIYTEEQAKRGGEAYAQHCASCHGDALEGAGDAPALVGSGFASRWNGMTMRDFFSRVSGTMPYDSPGSLSRQQYADIFAHILRANEYPAGSTELSPDADALRQIGFKDKPAGQ